MKRAIILLSTLFALLSCGHKVTVWEDPVIGATQYGQYTIKKVVFAKDSTALYFHVHYPSMGGFTFGKGTYIEADGKHYMITGCDGFELGEYTTTDPVTWEKDFTLFFEPMPGNTRMFDIIEGDFKGAYTFYNIRPKDVKLPVAKVPAVFLADYPEEDVWPAMKYSEDPVTIHFKALNYKPGMNARIDMWHFDITDPSSFNQETINLNDAGEYNYSCKTYYPQYLQIVMDPPGRGYASSVQAMMAPGEELTVLIDMNEVPDSLHDAFVGFKGYLAKYTRRNHDCDRDRMNDRSVITLAEWTAKHAKTVADIIAGHDSVIASFEKFNRQHGYSELESKQFFNYELRYFELVARGRDSLFRSKEFLDYILRIRPACFFDEDIVPTPDYDRVSVLFADTDVRGIGPDLCRYLYGVKQIRGGKKINKPFIEDPYLSNLYDRISGNVDEQMAKNKKNSFPPNVHYLDLADVAPENILSTILDRYKGKTVLLDMWETWCGWCIKGHEDMAPYKEEMKGKDIVFLYFASPSSPFDQWVHYTITVPGEHYYLTEEQNDYLSEKIWGTSGVPKYAIYDSNGNRLYKQVGWAGVDTLKTEIEKALK